MQQHLSCPFPEREYVLFTLSHSMTRQRCNPPPAGSISYLVRHIAEALEGETHEHAEAGASGSMSQSSVSQSVSQSWSQGAEHEARHAVPHTSSPHRTLSPLPGWAQPAGTLALPPQALFSSPVPPRAQAEHETSALRSARAALVLSSLTLLPPFFLSPTSTPSGCMPSPTLSPTDPVPRGLLTLCPGASSGPQGQ